MLWSNYLGRPPASEIRGCDFRSEPIRGVRGSRLVTVKKAVAGQSCRRSKLSPVKAVAGQRCHRSKMSPVKDVTGQSCDRSKLSPVKAVAGQSCRRSNLGFGEGRTRHKTGQNHCSDRSNRIIMRLVKRDNDHNGQT